MDACYRREEVFFAELELGRWLGYSDVVVLDLGEGLADEIFARLVLWVVHKDGELWFEVSLLVVRYEKARTSERINESFELFQATSCRAAGDLPSAARCS